MRPLALILLLAGCQEPEPGPHADTEASDPDADGADLDETDTDDAADTECPTDSDPDPADSDPPIDSPLVPAITAITVCERRDTGICNPGDFPLNITTTLALEARGLSAVTGSFWLAGDASPQVVTWAAEHIATGSLLFIACGPWPRGEDMAIVAEMVDDIEGWSSPVFARSYTVNAAVGADCP